MQKRCSACRKEFPETTEFFPANRAQRCGLHSECRSCRSTKRRLAYVTNAGGFRDKNIASAKRSYEANAEKCRSRQREKGKAEREQDRPAWRAKKRAEMDKREPARRRADVRKWRKANPVKAREQSARARKKHPLRSRISALVRMHLIKARVPRSRIGFENLLGYSVETLRAHLERQFTERLGWHNYRTDWEIDHIIPMRLFAVKAAGDAEFKAAWALSNLRPLARFENRSKGGKRILLI